MGLLFGKERAGVSDGRNSEWNSLLRKQLLRAERKSTAAVWKEKHKRTLSSRSKLPMVTGGEAKRNRFGEFPFCARKSRRRLIRNSACLSAVLLLLVTAAALFKVATNSGGTEKVETGGYHHPLYPGLPLDGALARPVPQRKLGDIGTGADIVIGVPTVRRERISYLEQTLRSLFENMFKNEQEEGEHVRPSVKVLVFIGEVNSTYVDAKMNEITAQFAHQLDFGLLEVISVADDYYPEEWSGVVHLQFGDALERTKWRSKQNLDQIFLMMYISSRLKPSYYLMMEDDVIAGRGYVDDIMEFVDEHKDREWFYLSFCNLGAIGKLFQARTLPSYAAFLHLFWNRKPLDWLQMDYVSSMACSYDKSCSECSRSIRHYMKTRKPSIFQHMGRVSSLTGKKQLLQDRSFKSNRESAEDRKSNDADHKISKIDRAEDTVYS